MASFNPNSVRTIVIIVIVCFKPKFVKQIAASALAGVIAGYVLGFLTFIKTLENFMRG